MYYMQHKKNNSFSSFYSGQTELKSVYLFILTD